MIQFDIEIQDQLIYAALDDFSPAGALSGAPGGQDGEAPEAWREAVIEFLHTMLVAGLITLLRENVAHKEKNAQEICEILRHGDPENNIGTEIIWNITHFVGTEKLVNLLRSLGLANWDAWNSNLSTSLRDALVEMGVVQK